MGEFTLRIDLVLDSKSITVQCDSKMTAEDVCIQVCKQLNISPLTRNLFALRVTNKSNPSKIIFLAPCDTFGERSLVLDFRIRFKVADVTKLAKIDIHAYDYYFHQVRKDVLENKIPGLIYENCKRELLGLGITDMYRVMLEKEIPKETLESQYRKYVPKEVWRRHAFFTRKPIRDNLRLLESGIEKSKHNALFVKAEYMRQLDSIAPDYLSETYKALIEQEGVGCNIFLKVSHLGVYYSIELKKDQWELICTIEDICFVSIREDDKTTEISRQNGIPFYLKFNSQSVMHSFISVMDGYYRLTCKWTFNICKELYTPSLQKLFAMKCHGPVGGEFSYKKLQSKRSNRPGCFIIRESESKYNSYFIDVCTRDSSKPKTYKLEKITGDEFIFHDDVTKYKTLQQLMKAYNDPNRSIYLQECIPPSEYDISPLLLCKSESLIGDSLTDSTALDSIIPTNPMCINSKNLQVFRDRKCLKWNKDRKKVKANGTIVSIPTYKSYLFPEDYVSDAKKYCRNPSGDIGGPWCFVEDENTNEIEKEYCDIPFCDDPICMVFSKDSDVYMHYTDFNNTLTNVSFGVKLWDSDSFLEASARLVLSLIPLPVSGAELKYAGVGVEIVIGNNFSALRYGNKDKPEYEPTHGILKSTEYTQFSLSWHEGFITLNLEGAIKPIFLAEFTRKDTLLGVKKNQFLYYSVLGTNVLWDFRFCKDDYGCDAQVTTGGEFQQFWPLRLKDITYDLYVHVRAFHSASILFVTSPPIEMPYVRIVISDRNNFTKVIWREHKNTPEVVLKEIQVSSILDYWKWNEFSVIFFAHTMNFYVKKPLGMHIIAEINNDVFGKLRWFSVSSDNTVAHWSFFCAPPPFATPPQAFLPECALGKEETNYNGTQDITTEGLPCLPWNSQVLTSDDYGPVSKTEPIPERWNYCRNPMGTPEGAYCYALSRSPESKIIKSYCDIRKCKSEQCRIAGTGNDYIGGLSITRSNRTCAFWDVSNYTVDMSQRQIWNDSLFGDMSAEKAKNYCRNPSRDASGSWCYTTDPDVVEDACNVRDCDKPEECTIIVYDYVVIHRLLYILPQWKERGFHGGLRFAVKEWNPDLLEGLDIVIMSHNQLDNLRLQIGADYNEKVRLIKDDEIVYQKTLPHVITAGKWTELWMQVRKGEMLFGFEGIPTPLFEWISDDMIRQFEPTFITFGTMFRQPIGIAFKCDECHTENISVNHFNRHYPITMWKEERSQFDNLTLYVRGHGIFNVIFTWVPNNQNFFRVRFLESLDEVVFGSNFHGIETDLLTFPLKNIMSVNTWTKYAITFNGTRIMLYKNDTKVKEFNATKPFLGYWFVIGAETGWVTWSANCEPVDLDGPPRDGGWSAWSPWTCTVTCGGGEGFRTRTCSNPRPNIFGKLCEGPPTSTGRCNDFPCGDVSPDTLEKIHDYLQKENFNYILEEGSSITLENNKDILKIVRKESPEAYYEWTLNGIYVKPEPDRITYQYDNIKLRNMRASDSGLYVCLLYRINKKKVVFRVITLAVRSTTYDVVTRATRSYTLSCNAVVLGQKREGSRGITEVSRSMWKVTKGKKIEIAIKTLKRNCLDQYLKEFTDVAGQWAFLSSSAIVRLYGIAFTNSISLVMEYFPLGPLDQYLRNNKGIIKVVDLIEASSNLASALWHLTENNIVHGKIRCRKLMVNVHDENAFTVKLTDPGVYTEYNPSEIHWIPIECYSNPALAKRSIEADVWSFATTLWELFSFGKELKSADHRQIITYYTSGKRLLKPQDCPEEIYNLMKECWEKDLHKRKKSQAIMRDINQILYQIYNSRKTHAYATVFKKRNQASTSTNSLISNATDSTAVPYSDDLISVSEDAGDYSCSSSTSSKMSQPSWGSQNFENVDSCSYDWSTLISTLNMTASMDSLNSTESVYELDGTFNIVLQGRIGQGFYGEVYKATMETTTGQDEELSMVAVKKLKTNATALSSCLQDFEREINIMKSLHHPNIVKILGVLRDPEISLVMEFVQHGSLQSYLKIHKETLLESQLVKYALDIAMGMEYLGSKNIVHRDLAARNILVVNENNVKISDFGLARVMGSNNYYILKTPSREVPIKWYAPESLRDGKFSVYSDVWSYGVTMCEMFSYGEEPQLTNINEEVEGQQQQVLLMAIEKGARFPCPPNCPTAVYIRLIYPCWEADPHKRPSFTKLILETEDLLNQY